MATVINNDITTGSNIITSKNYNMAQVPQEELLRLPAGFDPLNIEIMGQMEDSTLLSFCVTDKRAVALCNDEVFWRNRATANYALLLEYKEVAETWYQFYRRVYYDAYYLLMVDGRNYLYTNISLAYQKLLRLLQLLEGLLVENMTLEQLLAFDFDNYEFLEGNYYHILVVFKNRTITVEDLSSEIIFELSEIAEDRYLNPKLLSYPVLNPSGPVVSLFTMNVESDDPTEYTFLALTSETLSAVHNMSDDQAAYISIPDSGEQDDRLGITKYGFVMTRKDVVLALLNPALYSPEFNSEFFAFVAPRDYQRNEVQYTQQLITTPGAAYQLRDIALLLANYPWQ